ncbi:hypothetical protein [Nitrospira sp. BLG_2]|uniref:hypothetical protein n=1 Tax=Nitrospira sp. BLG_2 TaxID=3397507 RepID=UPI003B9E12F6
MASPELEARIEDQAEREGTALKRAFRKRSVNTLKQAVFSTHRGHGTRAVAPPSGSRMHRRAA